MSKMSLLIAFGCISLVGALLAPRRGLAARLRGRAATTISSAAEPQRRLIDFYALLATIIIATLYLPIVVRLPSAWAFLAGHFSHEPHLEVQLIGSLLPVWLGVCIVTRWVFRSGLTRVGRILWWAALAFAVLAWNWCSDAASYILLFRR
jgi:hypothetical protein